MRKEIIPYNKIKVGDKFFLKNTDVDYDVLILKEKNEYDGVFDRINIYKSAKDFGIERAEDTIIKRSNWERNIATYYFRRKHYTEIFDLLFD